MWKDLIILDMNTEFYWVYKSSLTCWEVKNEKT
jgi:hypothetical protein